MGTLKSQVRRLLECDLRYRVALAVLRRLRIGDPRSRPTLVLFKPDGIGDFVLASGLIRFLLRRYQSRRAALVVADYVEPLARREFSGCEVYGVPFVSDSLKAGLGRDYLAARRVLECVNPSTVIALRYHLTLYEDLLVGGLRAPVSYGCSRASSLAARVPRFLRLCRFRPTKEFSYPAPGERAAACPAELEAHRRLASLVAETPVKAAEILPCLETFDLRDNAELLVLPFGSVAIRNYPPDLLGEAVAAAGLPPQTGVRVCAEPASRESLARVAQAIARRNQGLRVRVVTPATSSGLAEEVAAARCVLTMESAGAHLAAALDKPAVVVLGGGRFGLFAPFSKSSRQRWLWQEMDCYGCAWHCRHTEPFCISRLPAARVGASIRELFRAT
jgi:hypothetical protein